MATKKGDGKRTEKVAEQLRGELMRLLLEGVVHDPATQAAQVSAVAMTDDLRIAKIYVRSLEVDPAEASRKQLLRGLERAKGFLRRELAQRLDLRYAPELRFYWDQSVDQGRDMERLLAEIRHDDGGD